MIASGSGWHNNNPNKGRGDGKMRWIDYLIDQYSGATATWVI